MLFYTQLFTSKRGPLAKIWLAAHWERKLSKAHVFECNLETAIRDIICSKMKMGLRTSGHLLLGVVRIYCRKAKYLHADCSDALVKIKMSFRPGQTDLPVDGLEATIKAITLIEDFSAFDAKLPPLSDIDVVDHFSLNQSRLEEITLKEDFGNDFMNFGEMGGESRVPQNAMLDISYHSLTQQTDAFGDEDKVFDLIDFLTNSSDPAESNNFIPQEQKIGHPENASPNDQQDVNRSDSGAVGTSSLNETSMSVNEEEAFTLEPVTVSNSSRTFSLKSNTEKRRVKRKRKLIVDQKKELSNQTIKEQISDYSDLLVSLDMAPPTKQLMQWKERGGTDKLFTQPCAPVIAPQIKELFAKHIFQTKSFGVCEEVEVIRQDRREVQEEADMTDVSVIDSSDDAEKSHNTEVSVLDQITNIQSDSYTEVARDERSEFTHPGLPSEDSMFVHPSQMEQPTQSASLDSQTMDSQDFEERRISRQAQTLLNTLKSQCQNGSGTTFSVKALCEGGTRMQAASTLFCLLVLKKQEVLHLRQSAPYEDIISSPGPKFYN